MEEIKRPVPPKPPALAASVAGEIHLEENQVEDRIDEHSRDMFASLGLTGRLPDRLVKLFLRVKRMKDTIQPGRISPEAIALVIALYESKE